MSKAKGRKKTDRPESGNFSFEKVQDFDRHIGLSIPNYDTLARTVLGISDYFLVNGRIVYDIGCSTGKLLEALDFPGGAKIGIDNSDNLLPVKFPEGEEEIDGPNCVRYRKRDLNDYVPPFSAACLIYSLFTLQFLEEDTRVGVIASASAALKPGGAFIIAEKVYAPSAKVQEIFTFTHYDYKREGFSSEDILRKEISLRRILRPWSSGDLRRTLEGYRFEPNLFWKFLNFEAWLCIKR